MQVAPRYATSHTISYAISYNISYAVSYAIGYAISYALCATDTVAQILHAGRYAYHPMAVSASAIQVSAPTLLRYTLGYMLCYVPTRCLVLMWRMLLPGSHRPVQAQGAFFG